MTGRLALYASVAATMLFATDIGASAQGYDVTKLVAEIGARRIIAIDPSTGSVTEIAGNLPIGLAATPGRLPTNIPTGVGASGRIYFSSDIENAIYKVVKK